MARALMLVASNTRDESRVDEFNEWYSLHVEELLELDPLPVTLLFEQLGSWG